ncbi:pyridoxal phosphate-dependent aminotransferase [Flavonifractor sp. An100]|uniref:pyridoxal phosphate-dependent aminotransferase n=1 Tax=Flavonifractor sp. An100 TaxID=1965538 RepID=UPI000B3914BD|nr:pyridoxal phosphate-dependent aminotransferase [Flavonifractor sp. An100]OUQ78249.1 aspartate aminotransferase [Flavonifractor sp. An100]
MRDMVSENAKRLEASPIRAILDRAAALRAQGKPVIPFSAGEPDFPTPEPIKAATMQAIADNYSHYASNRGLPALRKILAKKIQGDTGLAYDPETEILITSSGAEALNNSILTFVNPGDEVIIPTPAFVSYKNLVKFAGGTFVDIPLRADNGFQLDADEIEAHITSKTKMIILNNPNNPSGAVYSREVLERVAALAVKYDLLVLSDEMYSRLVYDGAEFISMAALPGMRERTIVVSGFSKSYAMTGWRLGYIATAKELAGPILKVHQYSTTCSPTFIQQGLVNSLELPETEEAVKEMLAAFARRREMIVKGLQAIPNITPVVPKGAFYVMVDVSATGKSGMEFAQELLEEHSVATVPAVGLGDSCGDYIRISYAASDEDIQEGLRRMEAFVKAISK